MSNQTAENAITPAQKLTHKDLLKIFWRSFAIECSFNYERMQGIGVAYSLTPILKKLYKTKEDLTAAIKRHIEFFNTTPQVSTFILGIVAAMEERKASGEDVDENAIRSVKSGLMGPLAGIGDSFFWGTSE
jgi:mannose/fructose/N-acetylgalactosamine-specific phosphotransferase system component IID